MGEAFASRVASSLLTTMNLKELITNSFDDYEKTANNICNDPTYLKKLKTKLKNNLVNSVLYDSETYTKNIEDVYKNLIRNL